MAQVFVFIEAILTFLRHYRLGSFSFIDTATAYLGVYILAPYLSKFFSAHFRISITRAGWLWLVLPLAFIVHILLGLHTAFVTMILTPQGYFIPKLGLVISTIMGIKNIKKVKGEV